MADRIQNFHAKRKKDASIWRSLNLEKKKPKTALTADHWHFARRNTSTNNQDQESHKYTINDYQNFKKNWTQNISKLSIYKSEALKPATELQKKSWMFLITRMNPSRHLRINIFAVFSYITFTVTVQGQFFLLRQSR